MDKEDDSQRWYAYSASLEHSAASTLALKKDNKSFLGTSKNYSQIANPFYFS